jgi:hypothetical protein
MHEKNWKELIEKWSVVSSFRGSLHYQYTGRKLKNSEEYSFVVHNTQQALLLERL